MSRGAAALLAGVALVAAAAWWYFTRGAGASTGYGGVNSGINTSGFGLPASAYTPATSGQQQSSGNGSFLQMINDSLGLTPSTPSRGGPLGIRDNNPGNLRYIANPARAWNGQVGDNQGFGVYSSAELGVRAMSHQLQEDFANGDTTLADLITTWAPPSENNTPAYIADVAAQTGLDPNAPLDLYPNLPAIVAAIIQHENGEQPYLMSDLTTWVYLS